VLKEIAVLKKLKDEAERAELRAAAIDLAKSSTLDSLLRFYSRHDKRIADAIAVSPTKLACQSGCAYCCYIKVVVNAVEVFAIAEYVKKQFAEQKLKQVVEQAKANVKQVEGLSVKEHEAINQQCPFLVENRCSIYPVRPSRCRNFHSYVVTRCKDAYEDPTDQTTHTYVRHIEVVSKGGTQGFEGAVRQSGFDYRNYDMNSAFVEAIENSKCFKRFKDRKKAFLYASVVY
jgi:Fe-S-cluster containining protein